MARIQLRRDTAANWASNNPVLAAGEPSLETDTKVEKIGDGVTAYNALPAKSAGTLADGSVTNAKLNTEVEDRIAGNTLTAASAVSTASDAADAAAAAAAAVASKVDKDDTITNGEILQKKTGGGFESAGVKVGDLTFTDPETLADQNTIAFTKNFGVMTTNTNRSITAITGIPGGGIALLRVVGTGTLSFSSLTGLRYQGALTKKATTDYLVKIINAGTTASPIYYVMDADGGGGTGLNSSQETLLNDMLAAKPAALALSVSGTEEVGEELTANYGYFDTLGRAESGTTFQWYRSDDAAGTNEATIAGATGEAYTAVLADQDKYLRCAITPTNASIAGSAWYTPYTGQIAEATTVPVVLGFETLDGSYINAAGAERHGQRVTPSVNSRISSISLHHSSPIAPTDTIQVAIYDGASAPTNKLGESAVTLISDQGVGIWHWQEIALSTPVDLTAATNYWLVWVVTGGSQTFKYSTTLGGGRWIGTIGSTLPDPMNDGTNVSGTVNYGIHADGIEI